MSLAVPPRRRPWWPALALWAALLVAVFGGAGLPQAAVVSGQLLRWQEAGHDWLLVADDAADQLRVYDAADGRLLRRLDARTLGDVARLSRRGERVYVVGDDGTRRELRLPQLTMVASGTP